MTDSIGYSSTTPKLGLPLLFTGQAQKEATVNEALTMLDLIGGGAVLGVRNDPPASPVSGQTWIVGANPTGAYAGQAGALAGWTDGGWRFVRALLGMRVYDLQAAVWRLYNGTWAFPSTPAVPAGGAVIDVEARAAIVALIQALKGAGIFSNS